MAKRKTGLTEEKIMKYEKEGRGQGVGPNYKPWINIQDFPSLGLVTRIKGWKTERTHQFLSKLERDYFYVLEWNKSILDIREQYPLSREDTMKIAKDKDIKHPMDPKTQVPIVMTTDFLITVLNSTGTSQIARTIKPSKDLENERTIEKFEIERSYWSQRGVDWGIVTEKDIPKNLVDNVEWLHSSFFEIGELPKLAFKTYLDHMKNFALNNNSSIIEMVTKFDQTYQLENGTGLEVLKHLIAYKVLKININKKIYTHHWVKDVLI